MKNILQRSSVPWVLPALAILVIVYLLPIAKVVSISFLEPVPGLGNYERLFGEEALRRIFWTTFRVSAITTLVSVALGYVVALAMLRASPRHFRLLLICVLIPFWVSVLVRAFAWVVMLRSGGAINSSLLTLGIISEPLELLYNEFGVIVGMVHYMVPLAVLTIYGQMTSIDTRLTMAARGLGATHWYAFSRIFVPMTMPGLLAASILIFISSLGFYIIPALLSGGKTLMLAEYVSLMITSTVNWGLGTAMASTLAVLVLLLIFAMSRVIDLRRVFGGV